MKNNIVVSVIIVAVIAVAIPFMMKLRTSSGSPSESPPANPSNTLTTEDAVKKAGVEVVNLLVNADTTGLSARVAPNMKTEMPPAQIIQGWNAVIAQAGAFRQ